MTASMILEHLSLVVAALIFAVLAGVPLGILCHFYPAARKIVLRVVDLIQTTPALALLGIIMVFIGPGKPTVIVGLALYSLLPIVRNTCLGLDQVPEHLIEAGRGMGMTRTYRLVHVEIPIAAPIIFTGIRIAAVNAIGTAVFASLCGRRRLGQRHHHRHPPGGHAGHPGRHRRTHGGGPGSGPADGHGGAVSQQPGQPAPQGPQDGRPGSCRPLLCGGPGPCACTPSCPRAPPACSLYEGQFSEVQLVNSMIKQLVEDRHGIPVTIQDEMTAVNNFNALTAANHSCDLMYTWDGTLLTTIMGLDTTDIPEGQTLYDFVNEKMNEEYDLQLLGKIGVNNTYVIGVTQEVVDTYHPETISDLVPIAGELRFCAEQDFFTDAGNMKFGPMVETYGLNFQVANPVDIMMKYTLIEQGAYDVMVVYATDGLNKRANLTLLDDDQHFFPDYYGTILARNDVFERFAEDAPGLKETIQLLNEQFTDELMSELTYRVDVAGEGGGDRRPRLLGPVRSAGCLMSF